MVAREDPDANAPRAQRVDGPPRVRAKRVPDAGDAGDTPVDRDEHGAETVGDDRPRGAVEIGGDGRAARLDVGPVPDADLMAVQPAGNSLSRRLRRLPRPSARRGATARARAERAGHGVRRLRLEVPRELERRVVALPARHRRPAFGERPGLVDQDGLDAAKPLEGVRVLDEDAGAGGAHQRDRDGERHGEAERARTGDDEQGDDPLQRDCGAAAEPRDGGDAGEDEQGLDEEPGHASVVRRSAGFRESASWTMASSAPTRVCVAGGVGAHDQPGAEVRGAGVHGVALPHRQRGGLAGQHGVVERRPAGEDDAIDGDELAGADLDPVAGRERGQRDLDHGGVGAWP